MQTLAYELLERRADEGFFNGRSLIIAGGVADERLIKLALFAAKVQIVTDSLLTARKMAAAVGQEIGDAARARVDYKGATVFFDTAEHAAGELEEADTLLLMLDKSKAQSAKCLKLLSRKLTGDKLILACGENTAGGRSAGTLLAPFGEPYKEDSRRKSTLFAVKLAKPIPEYQPMENIECDLGGQTLTLAQDEAVFSGGRIDPGTAMLLECLKDTKPASALDLGCGCGVVGITLKKLGAAEVVSSDISAAALALTGKNAALNGVKLQVRAADMLSFGGKYDLIAVNPPFHQGLGVERQGALNMIKEAGAHLRAGGALYLVGNTFLGYEKFLKESFKSVECLKKNTRYLVYRASDPL
ncbi:MAG: class I SAM-dependent methyltransferase [Succinivibrio sp.]|jgi:16S rRNA (guanine1207-N2)-methyltransferase|nr:class I SAM-dependent methyltransferase [Succinivibrio sp.]